ncbi:hypothetical protein ACOZ38_44390 [Sphaerisporangium viridialbum]|uniref:hypothetical protein n=1 Tax=Sphaerisporangium viridialbum TaxID=46189 RepID=UPI003C735F77
MTHHHTAPTARDTDAITPACPVDCLRTVLSTITHNTLTHAYGASFSPPRTVADVITLWHTHSLNDIWGLGRRRIGELEVALIYIGTPHPGNTLTNDGS